MANSRAWKFARLLNSDGKVKAEKTELRDGAAFTGNVDFNQGADVTGDITVTGNVDGVDVSAFKSDYDIHNHDGRYVNVTGDTITGNLSVSGSLTSGSNAVFHDDYHPNADKWTTARTLSLSGDASGSVSWDGSADATLSVAVANNSHTHTNTTLDMHFGRQTQNIDTYDPDSFWATSKGTGGSGTYPSNYVNVYNFAGNGVNEGTQLATYYGSSNKTWIRSRNDNNSSWLGWSEVWTSTTDGSGSGLDADLLDGYHSAENGASVNLRTQSNGYLNIANWVNVQNSGIYSTTRNSAHFSPNGSTSYGSWAVSGSRGGWYGLAFPDITNDAHLMGDNNGSGRFGLYFQGGGRWGWFYDYNNNCLGVGDSGTSSSYGIYDSGGGIYSTGNITAYSDRRKKENIVTVDDALDKVMNMRGVFYNKIDDETKTRQVGVIAQEMQEVCPEAVTYAEDVDEYGVSYGNLVGVLIEAIKEQQTQIDELKAKLEV